MKLGIAIGENGFIVTFLPIEQADMDRIKLMLEWISPPLWYSNDDGNTYPIDADELPIDDELKEDINRWNAIFQSTYNQQDPYKIGFSSKRASDLLDEALIEEGRSLYYRLKKELSGRYIVTSIYTSD